MMAALSTMIDDQVVEIARVGDEGIARSAGSLRRVRVLAVWKSRALIAYRISAGGLRVRRVPAGHFWTRAEFPADLLMVPSPGFSSAVREWRATLYGRVVARQEELDRARDMSRPQPSYGTRGGAIERASAALTKAARELAAFERACPEARDGA